MAMLVAASALQGCGDEVNQGPGSSSGAGEGGLGGQGGGASSSGSSSGQAGMGGQGGGASSSSSSSSGQAGMGGQGGGASSSSSNGGGQAGMGGQGGAGGAGGMGGAECTTDPAGIGSGVTSIGPSDAIVALCDGQTLVGNQSLNQLEIRGATGTLGKTYALPDKPFDIAYDFASDYAYATLFKPGATMTDLVRVHLTTGVVTPIPLGGVGLRVVTANNGLVFVTMSDVATFPNRPIVLVNGTNGTVIKALLIPYGGSLMAFDRAANLLYLADEGASPSKLERYGFDPVGQTLTLVQSRTNAGNNGVDLALSPDGLHVAFSCSQGNQTNPVDYKLHDINSADLNATFGTWTTGQYPTAAVFSPDNTRIMATNGSTMRRFGVATHTLIGGENVLQTCTNGSVRRIAVSPGGTFTYVLTKCGSPATSGLLSRFYFP